MSRQGRFRSTYPNVITEITRGSTEKWTFRITKGGVAQDITGWKFYLALSDTISGVKSAILVEIGATPSSPSTGIVILSMTDSQTLALEAGRKYYEIKYSKPTGDGELWTVDMGPVTVFECVNPRVKLVENSPSASPSASPSTSPSASPSSSPSS